MKAKVSVFVLSGVLLGMLVVGLSQTANTVGNSNTVANCTEADRRPRKLANGGNWTPEIERLRNIDANTGRPISNGTWNANCARWDYDTGASANYAANLAGNGANAATNALPRRKPPVRKRSRRPSARLHVSHGIKGSLASAL